jgi:hypothetical protein
MPTLIAAVLLVSIVALYLWGYTMNGRTPYPEGAVPILSCEICVSSCHVHPDNMTEELRKALAAANKLPECETKVQ